jgi:hypothetical protein
VRWRTIAQGGISQAVIYPHVVTTAASKGHAVIETVANTASDLTLDVNGDGSSIQTYHPIVLTGAAANDRQPPSFTITSPTNGQTVGRVVTVDWTATDDSSGVAHTAAVVDSDLPSRQSLSAPGPIALSPGAHTLDILGEDRAGNADGRRISFMVAPPPVTTITLSPPPNANNWNVGAVNVRLDAASPTPGVGVASITYSATGAEAIPSTTVPATTTTFTVSTPGITSLTVSARDALGNAEAAQTVAIRIDGASPACTLVGVTAGPPTQLTVRVQDALSGLASVAVTTANNATLDIPTFVPGSTAPLSMVATKIDPSVSSQVAFRITDVAGNVINCDPILAQVGRDGPDGLPRRETFHHLAQADSKVTVLNGTPGLTRLQLSVNGRDFEVSGLAAGETRVIDVGSAMRRGDNTIRVTAQGKAGGSATIMIADR